MSHVRPGPFHEQIMYGSLAYVRAVNGGDLFQ